jgi:predicted ATP-grasp superfamily ATP-dependent carboligase
VSARAAAESAARAGHAVTAVDAYADLDQHPAVTAVSMKRDFGARFSAMAAARVASDLARGAVVYLSPFENHRGAVARLERAGAVWGNPPAVLRRVRDPLVVTRVLSRLGFQVPAVSMTGSGVSDRWLVKPLRSGGGRGVRDWRPRDTLPPGYFLQQYVAGRSGSVVFVAAGGRAVPLGVTRQLIGEAAFGAAGYRYCGSILAAPRDRSAFDGGEAIAMRATALAVAAAREFGLVGVNGIDFVARDAEPHAVEINPRWTASMELVERAHGLSIFEAHAGACRDLRIPDFDWTCLPDRAVGKAIVFARDFVRVGDTKTWLKDENIRDVPRPGERIRAGEPVCTVFASARDAASCRTALSERAGLIYSELARWKRESSCELVESR